MNATSDSNSSLSPVLEEILQGCTINPDNFRTYMSVNIPRIQADVDFLTQHVKPSDHVLDMGAVPPLMVALLKQKGYDNLCVADPNASLFEPYFAKKNITWWDQDLTANEATPDQQFDVVCMNEVLEHLPGNVLATLGKVASYVKPGGILMLTTPNINSFTGWLSLTLFDSGLASKPYDPVVAQYKRPEKEAGYFGHLREYTAREVKNLMLELGFERVGRTGQASYLRVAPGKGRGKGLTRWKYRAMRWAAKLERHFPKRALFAKYLFRKSDSPA